MLPKHFNHGPEFQSLWARLRREVSALQRKGYYGDGEPYTLVITIHYPR